MSRTKCTPLLNRVLTSTDRFRSRRNSLTRFPELAELLGADQQVCLVGEDQGRKPPIASVEEVNPLSMNQKLNPAARYSLFRRFFSYLYLSFPDSVCSKPHIISGSVVTSLAPDAVRP